MKKVYKILRTFAMMVTVMAGVTSCYDIEEYSADPRGTFEQLWSVLDEHYCFFSACIASS